jgi:hypothetical protein
MGKGTRCYLCRSELTFNTIGLNKKFLGRNIVRFRCINCLADYLEIDADELLEKIDEFKQQGCTLFE